MRNLFIIIGLGLLTGCAGLQSSQVASEPQVRAIPKLAFGEIKMNDITFGGTTSCSDQTYAIKLTIVDDGPMRPDEFRDPCRSGSGPCNEMFKINFQNMRQIKGSLILADIEDGKNVRKTVNLSGTVLFWWPGLWQQSLKNSPTPRYSVRGESNKTYRLQAIPIPGYGNNEFQSALQITTYKDTQDGKNKISGHWDTTRCGDIALEHVL